MFWYFERNCIESADCLGTSGQFNNINSSNPWTWYIFPFVLSIFFINVLQFSKYRPFTSLVRFLPKYYILFDAIINGITLISFSVSLLLVYRNEKDFCTLIVNSMTLTKSLMSSDNFGIISLRLSIDSIAMKIKDACSLEGRLWQT